MHIALLLGACLICSILIAPLKYRKITNPNFIFIFEWTVVMFLSNMQLYGLYDVSKSVESIIVIGVIAFLVGQFIGILTRKFRFVLKRKAVVEYDYILKYKFLYFLGGICIIYFIPQFAKAIAALLSGNSMNTIRLLVQDETSGFSNTSKINNLLGNFIVLPSSVALEALCVGDFWKGKRDKRLLAITIIIIALRVISDSGRTPLVNFGMYMLFGYLVTFSKKNAINDKKQKRDRKLVKKYSIAGLLSVMLISLSRTSSTMSRQLYFYFAMAPVLFSEWKEIVDSANLISYGLTSMNGYLFSFVYLIKNLFGLSYPALLQSSYDMIAATDSAWKNIAQGRIAANAYVSAFWFMYTDGRGLGVILGMTLYGFIIARIYCKLINKNNVYRLSIYLFMLQGIMFSFIRFPFAKPYYALGLIVIYIACRKREKV